MRSARCVVEGYLPKWLRGRPTFLIEVPGTERTKIRLLFEGAGKSTAREIFSGDDVDVFGDISLGVFEVLDSEDREHPGLTAGQLKIVCDDAGLLRDWYAQRTAGIMVEHF